MRFKGSIDSVSNGGACLKIGAPGLCESLPGVGVGFEAGMGNHCEFCVYSVDDGSWLAILFQDLNTRTEWESYYKYRRVLLIDSSDSSKLCKPKLRIVGNHE